MAEINVGATMQAIADVAKASGLIKRTYGWPIDNAEPPCLVVDYPSEIDFDQTFGRGSDKAVFPFYILCGLASDRAVRDVVSKYIAGATGLKDALDGTLGGVVQTARVTDCQIQKVTLAGVDYLAAKFQIEVYS